MLSSSFKKNHPEAGRGSNGTRMHTDQADSHGLDEHEKDRGAILSSVFIRADPPNPRSSVSHCFSSPQPLTPPFAACSTPDRSTSGSASSCAPSTQSPAPGPTPAGGPTAIHPP